MKYFIKHCQVRFIKAVEKKKASFLAVVSQILQQFTQRYSRRFINVRGAVVSNYARKGMNHYAEQKTLTDVWS